MELIPKRLSIDYNIKPFDCGDPDLNGFLFDDAKNYDTELLAVTYLLENDNQTVAYFSLVNDKISIDECSREKTPWNRFRRKLNNKKRITSYPAMKIARLGVSQKYAHNGIGTMILDYLKMLFIDNNRTGCRFITVDAYRDAFHFYEKNDFIFLKSEDDDKPTRLMYFDLKKLNDSLND